MNSSPNNVFDSWWEVTEEDTGNKGICAMVKCKFDLFVDGGSIHWVAFNWLLPQKWVVLFILKNLYMEYHSLFLLYSMFFKSLQSPNSGQQHVDIPTLLIHFSQS